MYLRSQDAQKLHDEAEQPAEEGVQKSSGAITSALILAYVNSRPV